MSSPSTPAPSRAKHAINVTVRGDLLKAAREAKVNFSATLERALEEELAALKRRQWRRDHAQAIEAYNEFVRQQAPALEEARRF